jgi:hypothetical protein
MSYVFICDVHPHALWIMEIPMEARLELGEFSFSAQYDVESFIILTLL